jgi:hypothetical protein
MPIAAIIEHGAKPAYDLVDESGLLVNSVSFKPKREYVERKNAGNRAVSYVRAENPTMDISIGGVPIPGSGGVLAGICVSHPGNAVTIANFTGTDVIHGFANADGGLILFKDPTLDLSDSEEASSQIEITLYPFVATS